MNIAICYKRPLGTQENSIEAKQFFSIAVGHTLGGNLFPYSLGNIVKIHSDLDPSL